MTWTPRVTIAAHIIHLGLCLQWSFPWPNPTQTGLVTCIRERHLGKTGGTNTGASTLEFWFQSCVLCEYVGVWGLEKEENHSKWRHFLWFSVLQGARGYNLYLKVRGVLKAMITVWVGFLVILVSPGAFSLLFFLFFVSTPMTQLSLKHFDC